MFLKNQPRSCLHSYHDCEIRDGERDFLFISKLLGLVSIKIFTSNLRNLCSLFYTDHFLTMVEILSTKQAFFLVYKKNCLFIRRQCNKNGWMAYYGKGEVFKGKTKLKTNYEWCQWFNLASARFEQIWRGNKRQL